MLFKMAIELIEKGTLKGDGLKVREFVEKYNGQMLRTVLKWK
jgi:hypothetical protein